jgi:hypothetical protein
MSKTPLQTAIEQIQTKIAECPEFDNERGAYMTCKNILTALLPTEREVIEEAYEYGYDDRAVCNKQKTDYFTTKFNDNEQ